MIDEIVNNLQRIADRKCYPEDVLDGSIAQEWVDYIVDLQQENKQLKEDKKEAVKYINRTQMPEGYKKVLLEILGEKENE